VQNQNAREQFLWSKDNKRLCSGLVFSPIVHPHSKIWCSVPLKAAEKNYFVLNIKVHSGCLRQIHGIKFNLYWENMVVVATPTWHGGGGHPYLGIGPRHGEPYVVCVPARIQVCSDLSIKTKIYSPPEWNYTYSENARNATWRKLSLPRICDVFHWTLVQCFCRSCTEWNCTYSILGRRKVKFTFTMNTQIEYMLRICWFHQIFTNWPILKKKSLTTNSFGTI
jgi:hypothetical protein